ncbi:MAG: calcium-binding protein [Pseudomonadota bacterium]
MSDLSNDAIEPILGTAESDTLDGTKNQDIIIGLAGDDVIAGGKDADTLYGDYGDPNLLEGTEEVSSFSGYAETGSWTVTDLDGGHQEMTQTVQTEAGGVYEIAFSLAANFAAGAPNAAVEVLVNGDVVETVTTDSGAFSDHTIRFTANEGVTEITFRSISPGESAQEINTDGPAFYYDKEVEIGGQTQTVAAFADGQANLYQVLNGTLYVFDTASQSYEIAGSPGTVNVNSLGFNKQDDLLYAIAVGNGVDALGNAVSKSDLVMIDAKGDSYRIGETPYRSWTGDFDDQGNLWSFQSSMDRVAVIDVDSFDENGDPVTTVYKFDRSVFVENCYDLAFDASTQTFRGLCRPSAEGANATLLIVDISTDTPQFSSIEVTSTVINGVTQPGAPLMTFGAAIYDADGNLYVGGNGGDHDMNNATGTSGGIYRVVIDEDAGEARLVLMSASPKSYSNDGAADPTAESPFAEVDLDSSVLLRGLSLVATVEGELTYNDTMRGGAGQDTLSGGIGEDIAFGDSLGDTLRGDEGNDILNGGSGKTGMLSVYDAAGNRYDALGNLLPEDDDRLYGGAGDDDISGSAGHDMLDGGLGNDTLNGGSGNDLLYGGDGVDDMAGGSGNDILYGGSADDLMTGNSGEDVLSGGLGNDQLSGSSGDDTLDGGTGDDTLDGGSGDDALQGGTGADVLKGGSGNDALTGGTGADRLDGRSGNDTLDGGVDADYLKGGSGNDILSGGIGKDYLNGGSGDDILWGGLDDDRIYGSTGADILSGGAGSDRFVFREEAIEAVVDLITDFRNDGVEADRIDLRDLNLSAELDIDAWLASNLLQSSDGTVSLQIDTFTLDLTDSRDQGDAFRDEVIDGLLI